MSLDPPHEKGQLWELSGLLKTVEVSAAVYAAKGVIQFSITARHAMQLFIKII